MQPRGEVIMEATPPQKGVKYMMSDHGPAPASFTALTLKRYWIFGLSGTGETREVPVTNWSIKKSSWSAGLTTMRYPVARATAVQEKSGKVASTQPCGLISVGASPGLLQLEETVKYFISE